MKPQRSKIQLPSDLTALAAAAQGRPIQVVPGSQNEPIEGSLQSARDQRVAELKVRYHAGTLEVDASILASKLVDAHLEKPGPSSSDSDSSDI
jgi:hypothetical protein